MDYLCRTNGVNESIPLWVANSCEWDWINVIVSIFSTYLTVLLIAYLKWMESNRQTNPKRAFFRNHNLRSSLSIVLFLAYTAEFADAFLSHLPYYAFMVPASSLTFLVALTLLQHMAETSNHSALFFITGSLWLASGIIRLFRFGMSYDKEIGLIQLRPLTAAVASISCLTICFSEYVVVKQQSSRRATSSGRCDERSYRHEDVHFFSRITFHWMSSLLISGYKSPIELEDLGVLGPPHCAKELHGKLENIVRFKRKTSTVEIWKYFWFFVKRDFCIGGVLKLFGDLVGIVGPLGISVMVNYVVEQKNSRESVRDPSPTVFELWRNGWTMAFIVLFASIAQSTFSQVSTHFINVKSIHLRVALQSLIYKKSLKLRNFAKFTLPMSSKSDKNKAEDENVDFGALVNLMSNDTTNIMSFFCIGHYIWAIPLKMSAISVLLYLKLGVSAIFGAAGTIAIIMPLQLFIGKNMSRNTSAALKLSDERLQHLSILTGKIKLFKLLGWEDYYCQRILNVRKKELKLLDRDSVFWAFLTFFTHASSVLVSLITFGAHYLLSDVSLSADSVFSALALFNQLMVPLFIFPVIIPIIAEALVSCNRISDFLNFPDTFSERVRIERGLDNDAPARNLHKNFPKMSAIDEEDEHRLSVGFLKGEDGNLVKSGENVNIGDDLDELLQSQAEESSSTPDKRDEDAILISIDNGLFSWDPESPFKCLTVTNFRILMGEIIVIIGKVGSGKTSLLSAILGEMTLVKGRLIWRKSVTAAYCPQTPWLLNTTIRDNILFGLPLHPRRYALVIDSCALRPDLDILPKRDLTEIGEKGINLSGGQKQRIAIARALYSRANLVLLDDPFSSLEQSMAMTIFENGIRRLVRKCKRTVILATHNHKILYNCHKVVVMDRNQINAQGRPSELDFIGGEFLQRSKSGHAILKEHTAKERWQLIKSVDRIRRTSMDADMRRDFWPEENKTLSLNQSKWFEMVAEWKHIIHDLQLPTDELRSSLMECSSLRRRTSTKKKGIGRTCSLQDRHMKAFQVVRQHSSPLTAYDNKDLRNQSTRGHETLSNLRNNHRRSSVVSQKDFSKRTVSRVVSSESGLSDFSGDFPDEEDTQLGDNFINKDFEDKEYGKMRFQIYLTYIKACGIKTTILYLGVTLAWQVLRISTDFWLSCWIENPSTHGLLKNLSVYGLLSVSVIILSLMSHGLGQLAGSRARKALHDSMLLNVVRSPNRLFECTPAGRIFNRFSADVDIIDKKLATTIQRLMQFLLLCSSAIVVNAIITPWFIILTIPIVLLYYIIQKFYSCSSRELQRLDSITRSPIFSHFTETLSGLSSIRAFGYEDKFMSSFYSKLNLNTNCFLILNSANRWLGIVLDYLGSVIVFLAMITALVAVRLYPDSVSASFVGLAMNYTLLVPIYLNWVVKFFADCELYLGAVERVKQYSTMPTEKYHPELAIADIPLDWPKHGEIKYDNVTLGYGSSTEPVLIRINLHIPSGQKVGICGRSGSGKSTLALSLFNMVEIREGTIEIDDIDITKVPLKLLRSRASIIPQDTLLFNGTVRENLDPSGSFQDDKLWQALEEPKLKEVFETQFNGDLDSEMNAGQFLSGGQKQLFALARTTLQKSSFLIMDEATSNLDKESEQLLMATAQKVFKGKTLLIIAHRLSTILDCDRIIVLEKGKIVEDGPPDYLMSKNSGVFSAMVKSSEEGFLNP